MKKKLLFLFVTILFLLQVTGDIFSQEKIIEKTEKNLSPSEDTSSSQENRSSYRPSEKNHTRPKQNSKNESLPKNENLPKNESLPKNENSRKKESLSKEASIQTDSKQTDSKQENSTKKESLSSSSAENINFQSQVKVVLGDGRTVEGKIRLNVPSKILIKHLSDGVQYRKWISMKDVSLIVQQSWKGRYLKQTKKGAIYRFETSSYTVVLKNGQKLSLKREMLPFWEEFTVENSKGDVILFSYWIDLRKVDGAWYTGMKGSVEGKRVISHPDVYKKILFSI